MSFLFIFYGVDAFSSSPDDTLFETDEIIYDKNTKKFTTSGNVRIDYKNNKFLDDDGKLTTTDDKNSFKFEKFIFDAFYYADDMLLYRVNKEDFCPIKEKEDIEKAIIALENKMS